MVGKLYETPTFEVHFINFEVNCQASKDVIVDAGSEENWESGEKSFN